MVGPEKEVLHYPQLDTVLMVEEFIKEHSGEFKKRALWENLPRQMMYQTYQVVMDYLEELGKITYDTGGWVVWTWNPKILAKYLSREDLRVR